MEERRQAIHCRENIMKTSALTPRGHCDLSVGHQTWVKYYLLIIFELYFNCSGSQVCRTMTFWIVLKKLINRSIYLQIRFEPGKTQNRCRVQKKTTKKTHHVFLFETHFVSCQEVQMYSNSLYYWLITGMWPRTAEEEEKLPINTIGEFMIKKENLKKDTSSLS